MFLQIMALAWDISNDDFTIGQFDTGDFPLSRVWFLGFGCVDFVAHALSLITAVQGRRFAHCLFGFAAFPNNLIQGGHACFLLLQNKAAAVARCGAGVEEWAEKAGLSGNGSTQAGSQGTLRKEGGRAP